MNSSGRYERARRASREQLRESDRHAESLAATRAARYQAAEQQKFAQKRLEVQKLQGYIEEVLTRLDNRNFPGVANVAVSKRGFFGARLADEPGWKLASKDFTYTIRSDELTATRHYFLLADGSIASMTSGYVSQTHSGPPQPQSASGIRLEAIVADGDLHISILRALGKLAGTPEIF